MMASFSNRDKKNKKFIQKSQKSQPWSWLKNINLDKNISSIIEIEK